MVREKKTINELGEGKRDRERRQKKNSGLHQTCGGEIWGQGRRAVVREKIKETLKGVRWLSWGDAKGERGT